MRIRPKPPLRSRGPRSRDSPPQGRRYSARSPRSRIPFLRGAFLRIDSSYYFGALMLSVGAFYFYCYFMKILYVFPSFIFMAFTLASLSSFAFFHNKIHAKSYVFFLFCALFTFFFQIDVLPLAFFVAILCFSVIIFILSNMI